MPALKISSPEQRGVTALGLICQILPGLSQIEHKPQEERGFVLPPPASPPTLLQSESHLSQASLELAIAEDNLDNPPVSTSSAQASSVVYLRS